MKKILPIIPFALLLFHLGAQPVYNSFSSAACFSLQRNADNELLAACAPYWMGTAEVWKLNADGDTLWSVQLPNASQKSFQSLYPTADGAYAVCAQYAVQGDSSGLYVAKVSDQGQVLWQKDLITPNTLRVKALFSLADQSLVGVGTYGVTGTPYHAVVRLNSTADDLQLVGTVLVEDDTLPLHYQTLSDAYLSADEQFVVSVCSDQLSGTNINTNAHVLKTTVNGQLIWKTTIDEGQTDNLMAVTPLSDGNMLVTGYSNDMNGVSVGRLLLVKLDTNGQVIWTKTYESMSLITPLSGCDVMELPNGEILVTGRSNSAAQYSILLLIIDAQGQEIKRVALLRNDYDDSPVQTTLLNNNTLAIGGVQDQLGENRGVLILLPLSALVNATEIQVDDPAFAAFPNPCASVVQFSYSIPAEQATMNVFNQTGQLIYTGPARPQFQLEDYAPGVYVVVLRDEASGKAYLRKVVKQ
ncbi:MAG: T9SS type A sorting domain-containing protein [Saprospiraceae bacterium]